MRKIIKHKQKLNKKSKLKLFYQFINVNFIDRARKKLKLPFPSKLKTELGQFNRHKIENPRSECRYKPYIFLRTKQKNTHKRIIDLKSSFRVSKSENRSRL